MRISRRILLILAGVLFTLPAAAAGLASVPELVDGAPSYVHFQAIFVPIIEKDRVTRQIGVTLMTSRCGHSARNLTDVIAPSISSPKTCAAPSKGYRSLLAAIDGPIAPESSGTDTTLRSP